MSSADPDHFTDMDGNALEDSGAPVSCPFCGSGADPLRVERWTTEDDPDPSRHVECLKWGRNGPQEATPLEAAQGWNGRSK
jgi:hypothetical protein